jgi:hypothetical protein
MNDTISFEEVISNPEKKYFVLANTDNDSLQSDLAYAFQLIYKHNRSVESIDNKEQFKIKIKLK